MSLGRWVALTVYSTHLPDERAQRRFRRGYEMARRLGTHPNAVTVLEFGLTPDGQPYIATEIYERGTLEGRVEGRQPLSVAEVLSHGVALAGALETAHRAGVIHGGVHPARILLSAEGEPALADLGLVPLIDRGGLAALVGPIAYHSPPEVLEGETVTAASDVYSLASTLYTALRGRAPYAPPIGAGSDDDTAAALLIRVLQHDVAPVGRPDVPPSLEHVLRQALRCSPTDRPPRPLALAQALQQCQQELGIQPTRPIVLDIAAGLAVAPPEPPAPPPSPAPPLSPAPAMPTTSAAPAAPTDRVFIPYEAPPPEPAPTPVPQPPSPARPSSTWPAPVEQRPMPSSRPDPLLDLPPLPPRAEPTLVPHRPPQLPQLPQQAPRPASPLPRPELPTQTDDVEDEISNRARALPVIILALLVVVIFAGVTWSIVTGESNEGERAQPGATSTPSGGSTRTAEPRSGLSAVENSSGVQLDWDGGSQEPQVVLVLSTVAPPRSLPADTGTALLIPANNLDPAAGYCFAVVAAPDPQPPSAELAAGIPESALGPDACIRNGSASTILRQ